MLGRKRMLRTPEYKLIDYGADYATRWELFDMQGNPSEMRNLADDRAHGSVLREMAARLDAWESDAPPPIRIPGMPTPSYSHVPAERRNASNAAYEEVLRRQSRWRWPQ